MALNSIKERGVLQGPIGSYVRDVLGFNGDIFSKEGLVHLRKALTAYYEAGATLGVTPTFRLTNLRRTWEYNDDSQLYLNSKIEENNRTAVRITRDVYGENFVASISPLSCTSGSDDEQWAALGEENQVDWAMQRHRPQMQVLHDSGVSVIWCEAFRYRNEAIAVARLAKELGFAGLVVNFEANENGIPDPAKDEGYRFLDMKNDLQNEAGDTVEVFVGANCTGVDTIGKIWEGGDRLDTVYANSLDFEKNKQKDELAILAEKVDPSEEDKLLRKQMEAYFATSLPKWFSFYRKAISYGALVIGGCCGTTPDHTEAASAVYNRVKQGSF